MAFLFFGIETNTGIDNYGCMRRFLTLSAVTAIEITRQPVYLLLTITCIVLTALVPMVLLHQFGEEGKIARDSGLAFHLVFGIVVAGYAASSALAHEIRNGTASLFLSKPVSRNCYFMAKFVGVLIVTVGFSWCATLSTLLAERVSEHRAYGAGQSYAPRIDWLAGDLLMASPFVAILIAGLLNYWRKCAFQSAAFPLLVVLLPVVLLVSGCFDRFGSVVPYQLQVDWRILAASLLVTFALCVFAAIAISLSTRLFTMPTIAVCVLVLFAGLVLDYTLTHVGQTGGFAAVLRALIPNWQHFWRADVLTGDGVIAWTYVCRVGAYAAMYVLAVLSLGLLSFSRVDMK